MTLQHLLNEIDEAFLRFRDQSKDVVTDREFFRAGFVVGVLAGMSDDADQIVRTIIDHQNGTISGEHKTAAKTVCPTCKGRGSVITGPATVETCSDCRGVGRV